MRLAPTPSLFLLLGLVACGGGGSPSTDSGADSAADSAVLDSGAMDSARPDSAVVDSGSSDASSDAGITFDASGACYSWLLLDQPISTLTVMESGPFSPGRTLRVMATMSVGGCDELAPPTVTMMAGDPAIHVAGRVWRRVGAPCPAGPRDVDRPIALRPLAGSTRIDADVGFGTVDLVVGADPARACAVGHSPCEQDCDCGAGLRCLGGEGLAGPFTECAVPCESDRDCGGAGRCSSIPDGLASTCETSSPECDASTPCPHGFECVSGACSARFALAATSRHECSCDVDCDPGMSCVRSSGLGGTSRCEARCLTGEVGTGVWCQGAHACGPPAMDVAGLALSDAVCGWLGE